MQGRSPMDGADVIEDEIRELIRRVWAGEPARADL